MNIYSDTPLINQNQQQQQFEINLYQEAPEEEITLEFMKQICMNRVKLLRQIEQLIESKQFDEDNNEKDNQNFIIKQIKQNGLYIENNDEQAYLRDNQSHFLTRLAYCKSDENQIWFVKQETRLFKARLMNATTYDLLNILNKFNITYQKINMSQIDSKLIENIKSGSGLKLAEQQASSFYQMKFEDVLDLVANLQCYIHKGNAYIPEKHLSTIVVKHFKNQLFQQIRHCKTYVKSIVDEDERIGPILNHLPDYYFGNDYNKNSATTSKTGKINLADLDIISKRSFPPCMRHLYDQLQINSHLKHFGRLQLGLFLKGAGLSMDDSILMWKRELTKKITSEKFEREYKYNIEHNYGKQGKRTDYTPKSCMRILQYDRPSTDDHHGCPYKDFSDYHLGVLLKKMGVDTSSKEYQFILEKKQNKHFQIACRKTFEQLHPGIMPENVGQHPNGYFETSFQYFKGREDKAPKNTTTTTSNENEQKLQNIEKKTVEKMNIEEDEMN